MAYSGYSFLGGCILPHLSPADKGLPRPARSEWSKKHAVMNVSLVFRKNIKIYRLHYNELYSYASLIFCSSEEWRVLSEFGISICMLWFEGLWFLKKMRCLIQTNWDTFICLLFSLHDNIHILKIIFIQVSCLSHWHSDCVVLPQVIVNICLHILQLLIKLWLKIERHYFLC